MAPNLPYIKELLVLQLHPSYTYTFPFEVMTYSWEQLCKRKADTKMQLKIMLGQVFTKNNFVVFVSTVLFIGCAAFVAFRGYRCFDKYFKKPELTEISYQSSKNHPFPSFSLCFSEKDSYNYNQMKECQLEHSEYLDGVQWVGKGGVNCTDPKNLHNQVAANSEDLEIERILIMTYALSNNTYNFQQSNFDNMYLPSKTQINQNLSIFEWKLALVNQYHRCFTFKIPDDIVHEDIKKIRIESKPFYILYLHTEGTLTAPIPGSSMSAKYADLFRASVTREKVELLNYDGNHCNNDGEYNYDKCKQDYIYKVYQNAK